MVAIGAGGFAMGAGPKDRGAAAAEKPQHKVTDGAHAFAVSKFEITFDEWDACALEGGCSGYMPEDSGWGRGRRPAIYVSYDDAKSYVEWLRQKTGKAYRLLTEAEWEYRRARRHHHALFDRRDHHHRAGRFRRQRLGRKTRSL